MKHPRFRCNISLVPACVHAPLPTRVNVLAGRQSAIAQQLWRAPEAPGRLQGRTDDVRVHAEVDLGYEPELDAMERMEKSIDSCERELAGIRTGRAQPAMLTTIEVDYYGAPTPLQSLASISAPDAETLTISPFDKGSMATIEAAIMNSGLGFTPSNDGSIIRINVPQLTEERRKQMAKLASGAGETAKVAIRNVRRDVLKKVGQLDLSKDDVSAYEKEIQDLTDGYCKKVEELVAKKSKELTTV